MSATAAAAAAAREQEWLNKEQEWKRAESAAREQEWVNKEQEWKRAESELKVMVVKLVNALNQSTKCIKDMNAAILKLTSHQNPFPMQLQQQQQQHHQQQHDAKNVPHAHAAPVKSL
jgi:hypothetical protein